MERRSCRRLERRGGRGAGWSDSRTDASASVVSLLVEGGGGGGVGEAAYLKGG